MTTHATYYDALSSDDVARIDTRTAFTAGFETALKCLADPRDNSYTAAQQARSDALAAAAWILNEFTLDDISKTLLDIARPLATWIEHGDPATPQT